MTMKVVDVSGEAGRDNDGVTMSLEDDTPLRFSIARAGNVFNMEIWGVLYAIEPGFVIKRQGVVCDDVGPETRRLMLRVVGAFVEDKAEVVARRFEELIEQLIGQPASPLQRVYVN